MDCGRERKVRGAIQELLAGDSAHSLSSALQVSNLGSQILTGRLFQVTQPMDNPGSAQEMLQDAPSALPVRRFGHPGVLLANLRAINPVSGFTLSQDGEVSVEQHLG